MPTLSSPPAARASRAPWLRKTAFAVAVGALTALGGCRDTGDITGSISSKRGTIEEMTERGQAKVLHAKVPLSEMFGYTTQLRSMTSGQGSASMEFDHYEVVPPNVEKEIAEKRK